MEGPVIPTIALVDDDRNILTSLSMALEASGYQVNTYTDGFTALDSFQTEPPDLAILDIKMPRMDGMETLRLLRKKSDLPVIFLTSKEEEVDELVGLKMGADDYIRKPFSARLTSTSAIEGSQIPETVTGLRMPGMSHSGHSRQGGASCRSGHVRNAPLATVVPKKAACR